MYFLETMQQSAQLTSEDISFIDRLAREGGRVALEMREGVGVRTKTGPTDFVTDADLLISQIIVEALQLRFPDDLIVSEEDATPANISDRARGTVQPSRIWLIDPIDGTENYVKKDGNYTCMIGLLVNSSPYYGWIYQPAIDTLYHGGPDHGAWKHQGEAEPERYPQYEPVGSDGEIRAMMGWTDRRKFPWVLQLPRVKYVSSESLGLKIIKVLEDQADVFISLSGRVKLWDTAAPAAIALGSGLDVGTVDAQPLPYPLPLVQHGSSVIIGRPGSISWATQNLHGRSTSPR